MTSVEKVKLICKAWKTPISKLERELGFANGYIGQLKKGSFPDDRLAEIAQYLKVPIGYLMGTEEEEFFSEEKSKEICKRIVAAFRERPDLERTFIIPREIKSEIWAYTYQFSTVTFPQFQEIVGDIEEKRISAAKNGDALEFTEDEINLIICYRMASEDDKCVVDMALKKYRKNPEKSERSAG